jgi:GNAT superfamily N-acetyltransferase
MPVADDPSRPHGRLLTNDDGARLGRFVAAEGDGRPLADLFETFPDAPLDGVAERILADLAGWKVAPEPRLGEALVARGARPTRHVHLRSRDLRRRPPGETPSPPPGVTIGPLDRGAAELGELYAAAYSPGHADWTYIGPPADPVAYLEALLDGATAGPRLEISRLAIAADRTPAGVLIVTRLDGEPPFGGPWVAELFRRPGSAHAGTGRALLLTVIAAAHAAGLPALGLAVSEGNPAERLYAALGFERILSALAVDVPA